VTTFSIRRPGKGPLKRRTRVVGLDLGASGVRAAEVEFVPSDLAARPVVTRCAAVPLDPIAMAEGEVANAPLVTSAVREAWRRGGFTSRRAVLGLSGQQAMVRGFELPKAPLPELRAALPFAAQDAVSLKIEDCVLDYYPTAASQSQVRGLLVAAVASVVTRNVAAVAAAGVRAVRVDLAPFALARVLARGAFAHGTVAIVDVGAGGTEIVVTRDGVPQMARALPLGGTAITRAVAKATGLEDAEAEALKLQLGLGGRAGGPGPREAAARAIEGASRKLAEAVAATLRYHVRRTGQRAQGIVLVGGGGQLRGFGQFLSNWTGLPTAPGAVESFASIRGGARRGPAAPSAALPVAVGLALAGGERS
jgi:type IV pilus assembly protein PilM